MKQRNQKTESSQEVVSIYTCLTYCVLSMMHVLIQAGRWRSWLTSDTLCYRHCTVFSWQCHLFFSSLQLLIITTYLILKQHFKYQPPLFISLSQGRWRTWHFMLQTQYCVQLTVSLTFLLPTNHHHLLNIKFFFKISAPFVYHLGSGKVKDLTDILCYRHSTVFSWLCYLFFSSLLIITTYLILKQKN